MRVADKRPALRTNRTPDLRKVATTVVGWLILAILAYFVLGAVLGTIRWLVRMIVVAAVLVGLLWAYTKLKTRGDK